MIQRHDRHETARDRARVAAELLEEARQLTETAMLSAAPPDTAIGLPRNGNGHGNHNGNGNGHGNGHGNGNGHGHGQRAHDRFPAADPVPSGARVGQAR